VTGLSAKRSALAEQQHRLLSALVGPAAPPERFDRDRLAAVRQALHEKRAFSVAAAWPGLVRPLGDAFPERFADFSRRVPPPAVADGVVDGRRFARHLAGRGELSDAGRVQALSFDLHYRVRGVGVVARRGPGLRVLRLRRPPYLVVGARIPLVGARVGLVPLSRRRLGRDRPQPAGARP
jgi:hypothetical protein